MIERPLTANTSVACPINLLDSDEQALWWDRPDSACYARRHAGGAVFVGVFFVGIASFMVVKAIEGGSYFAALFCACFVAVGLYAMSEPLRRYLTARNVVYLLTDKRAVVADERVVKSVSILMIKSVEVTQTGGHFADVLYCDHVVKGGEDGDRIVRDGFIGIADAEAVAREMRRLQASTS